MIEVEKKSKWRQAEEEKLEWGRFRQRQLRVKQDGLTPEEFQEKERQLRERREQQQASDEESERDRLINRRVALWGQRERIVAYLPRLYEQREEALRRLADLDQLIADEEAAAAQIDRQVA